MSLRGRLGLSLLLLGMALLIGALALWQNNRHEALAAEEASREAMAQLTEAMISRQSQKEEAAPESGGEEAETTPEIPEPEISEPAENQPMDTIEVDGYAYIGFLTIPELQLELPVMDRWDYDRLKTAPCRFTGTLAGNDLVIAAHNFQHHFGHLMDLRLGAEICFTDVNGVTTRFFVADMEILQPTAIEEMTAGDYDLTLFTCTYGGATRFTVRCLRA